MPSGLQPTPGVSNRRSACDRCRRQKLRCLRGESAPDSEGRCDRCAKANARCTTSPIYHVRNVFFDQHPAVSLPSTRKKRRIELEPEPEPEPEDASAQAAAQTPCRNGTAAVISLPSGAPASIPTPNSINTFTSTAFDWSSVGPCAQSTSTSKSHGARPSSISASFTPPTWNWFVSPWDTGDSTLEQLFSADNVNESDQFLTFSGQALADHECNAPSSSAAGIPSLPYGEHGSELSSPGYLGSLDLPIQNHDASNGTHDYMEELSKINLDLVTQLRRIEPPHVSLETLMKPDDGQSGPSATTPLEDILNSTRIYLDVLSLIAGSSSPYSASNMPKLPGSYSGYNSASTSASQDESRQSPYSSPASTQPSNSIGVSRTQPDNMTQLQLLICYVHVLRLNVALFTHMEQHLQAVSESDLRTIKPLRGLCGISNVLLESGNLQASMIIQLVTNMFERIEALLGLPREFRIGTRKDSQQGLLRNEGFLEFAKAIIRKEDVGSSKEGKGGMRSLRKNIKKAKQLLCSHIAP